MVKLKHKEIWLDQLSTQLNFPCDYYALEQTLMDELKMEYESVTSSKNGQLPVGLNAQLVKHCTGIADVMNLVQA